MKDTPLGFEKAFKRMVAAGLGCTSFMLLFYSLFPPELESHWIGALYAFSTLVVLWGVLRFCPRSKMKWAIIWLQFTFLTSFIPISWQFVIKAWNQHLSLVEHFPPIMPFIIVTSALLLLLMNVGRLPYYIIANWFLIAVPMLTYLIFHPSELNTPRGLELLFAFGPTSLFFILVVPYQLSYANKYHRMLAVLQRTQNEADRDYLTDLRNQRGLKEWRKRVTSSANIVVLKLGVENFAHLKATFGYAVADRILIEFASRLRIVYQGSHGLARWRGEEFLAVLVNPEADEIENIADDFHSWLGATGYKGIDRESILVNIGVSDMGNLTEFDQLQKQADWALRCSKKNGIDQVCFHFECQSSIDCPTLS
ncbi:GGDEF domain-containing protein [Marinomonas balearica]|uniref:Diguanylate cyclase (GGDEF)-like protein n=1 Tax=Marinomonas balearica TaxID=491947 RepID=A0A4R6M792_9GAMM|nr:GGDEF domain-containing protein [Marinomonas balearica]TDO97261.1 diguanylate cyclase (GGDEF)-like protein [Marinomonas balearica]